MASPSSDAVSSWTRKRARASSKASATTTTSPRSTSVDRDELGRVQSLLQQAGHGHLRVTRDIGDGTFSRVYMAKTVDVGSEAVDVVGRVAIKCLVPTSSCDRVLTEIEALKVTQGQSHVVPLLFFQRINSQVILGMPYVRTDKFSDLLHVVDEELIKSYMSILLKALSHVHSLGLIHRDVKPSNFLFARDQPLQARLVDFGLAQKDANHHQLVKRQASKTEEGMGNCTTHGQLNGNSPLTGDVAHNRGKRRRKSGLNEEKSENLSPSKKRVRVTQQGDEGSIELRRSPRKHLSSIIPNTCTPGRRMSGFSKLKISGSTIIGANNASNTASPRGSFNRNSSFTAIDPTSGIPSDSTPKLNASLTSRASVSSYFHQRTPSTLRTHADRSSKPFVLCKCLKRPRVCDTCLQRPVQKAARAGTPGFRPPEVLLKYDNQSTAVDMWGVGVILLSLLARAYPFFIAPDDYTALAELIVIFGSKAIQEAAESYGKHLLSSERLPGVDLGILCHRLANRPSIESTDKAGSNFRKRQMSETVIDLLRRLLALKDGERITADEALKHPFFNENKSK